MNPTTQTNQALPNMPHISLASLIERSNQFDLEQKIAYLIQEMSFIHHKTQEVRNEIKLMNNELLATKNNIENQLKTEKVELKKFEVKINKSTQPKTSQVKKDDLFSNRTSGNVGVISEESASVNCIPLSADAPILQSSILERAKTYTLDNKGKLLIIAIAIICFYNREKIMHYTNKSFEAVWPYLKGSMNFVKDSSKTCSSLFSGGVNTELLQPGTCTLIENCGNIIVEPVQSGASALIEKGVEAGGNMIAEAFQSGTSAFFEASATAGGGIVSDIAQSGAPSSVFELTIQGSKGTGIPNHKPLIRDIPRGIAQSLKNIDWRKAVSRRIRF